MGGLVTIRAVRGSNIVSYRSLSIELTEGFTAIIGPNGAGKSSVIDAIYYSLTGESRRGPYLITRGRPQGSLELDLTDGEASITVSFQVTPGRRSPQPRVASLRVNGKLVASKKEEVMKGLKALLGLTGVPDHGEFMSHAVVIGQATLHSIAESLEKPRKLGEILDAAIGSRAIAEAIDRIEGLEFRYRDEGTGEEVSSTPGRPERLGPSRKLKDQLRELERDRLSLLRVSEELGRARERLRSLEERVREAEETVREAEGLRDEVKAEVERLEAEKARLEEAAARLEAVRRRLREARGRLEELERRAEELRRQAELAKAKGMVEEARRLDARIKELSYRLSTARRLYEKLEEARRLEEDVKRLGEVEDRLSRLEAERSRLASRAEELKRRVSSARKAVKALQDIATGEGIEHVGGQDLLQALEARVKALEERARELEERAREGRERAAALEAEAGRASKALELLEAAGGTASCPLCGSPLSEGRLEEVKKHLSEEAEGLRREAEALRLESERLEEEARVLSERALRLRQKLGWAAGLVEAAGGPGVLAELERLEEELRRVEGDLGIVEEEVERLRGDAKRLAEARGALERELREAEKASMELGFEAPPSVEGARRLVEEIEAELREAEAKLDSIMKGLESMGFKGVEEAEESVRRAERAEAELRGVEAEARRLSEVIEDLEAEARELEPKALRLKEVEARLGEARKTLKEAEEVARDARRRLEELKYELGAAREAVRRLEGEVERLKARVGLRERLVRSLTTALAIRRILEETKEAAYRETLRRLEDEMNNILASFRVPGILSVSFEDTREGPRLKLVDYLGREAQVSSLSGGEKTILAIAFILALNRAVGSRIGFLILDEPTAELDEENRRTLVRLLRDASREGMVKQLIVVTHHEDVADMADRLCRAERGPDGFSRIGCEE